MALIELTTSARIKTVLAIDPSDTTEDAWISAAIQSVSQRIELHMDRPIELVERTEEYDLSDRRRNSIFLRTYPVTEIASVKNDSSWDFDNATAIDSELYRVDAENGVLYFALELDPGPRSLKVVYTAGLATNTTELIANYPVIAQAADLQIAALFRRRATPQGESSQGAMSGTQSFEAPLKLIPEVRESLIAVSRRRFGL